VSRKRQKDETRRKLFSTSLSLFIKYGYDKVSVDQIVEASGVSKGTFYHYFVSKSAILIEYSNRLHEELLHEIKQVLRMKFSNYLEELKSIFDCIIRFYSKNHVGLRLLLIQSTKAGNKELGFTSISKDLSMLIAVTLENGKRTGEFSFDMQSVELGSYMITLFYQISNQILLKSNAESKIETELQSAINRLLHLFFHGIVHRVHE
jgi:AcrR family transcriptional regulator